MKYIKIVCNLLESMSNGNMFEVKDWANEICNLVMDGVQLADYEQDVAEEFFEDLDDEITEYEYCGYED